MVIAGVLIGIFITNSHPQTVSNTSTYPTPATNLPLPGTQTVQNLSSSPYFEYSYDDVISKLQSSLRLIGVTMSDPTKFSSTLDISSNCNFMSDPSKQALVKYCTMSELGDKNGTIGNINMIGSTDAPGLVMVLISSDDTFSNIGKVRGILDAVITDTICSCWNAERPNGYVTSADMINALRDTQIASGNPSSTTHPIQLGNKHFQLEITNDGNSYLWKLLVAR